MALKRRSGMTVLELIIATTMLTMVLTTVGVVMRTSHAAWKAHEDDFTRLEAGHATVRHIVRKMRQVETVVSITDETVATGALSVQMPDGQVLAWRRGSNNVVYFGENTADQLLAEDITGLRFVGYRADGTTKTTTVSEIQALEIEVTVELPRELNGTRTLRSWAWVRVW